MKRSDVLELTISLDLWQRLTFNVFNRKWIQKVKKTVLKISVNILLSKRTKVINGKFSITKQKISEAVKRAATHYFFIKSVTVKIISLIMKQQIFKLENCFFLFLVEGSENFNTGKYFARTCISQLSFKSLSLTFQRKKIITGSSWRDFRMMEIFSQT